MSYTRKNPNVRISSPEQNYNSGLARIYFTHFAMRYPVSIKLIVFTLDANFISILTKLPNGLKLVRMAICTNLALSNIICSYLSKAMISNKISYNDK